MIPITTPERYLSGTAGLNIPCPGGTDGDWRMRAVLTSEGKKLELAGEGEGTIVPKPPSKVKYQCPECGMNVWGKPDLSIICGSCWKPETITHLRRVKSFS